MTQDSHQQLDGPGPLAMDVFSVAREREAGGGGKTRVLPDFKKQFKTEHKRLMTFFELIIFRFITPVGPAMHRDKHGL